MIFGIYISSRSGADVVSLQTCDVVEGRGVVGDRYALGCGFYSGIVEWDAHVTLMPIEPIEALVETYGVDLDPRVLSRNFLKRGIDPMILIGRDFQVGTEVVLRGVQGMATVFADCEAVGEA